MEFHPDIPIGEPVKRPVGRPRKVQPEVAPSAEEPIEQLRERLISEWTSYVRSQGAKSGKEPVSVETMRQTDSFCLWVAETPEGPLRKWAVERDIYDARIAAANKARMEAGREAVCALYAALNGRSRKVTLAELEISEGYKQLSPANKFMARYFIENLQRLNSDGLWILSNRS